MDQFIKISTVPPHLGISKQTLYRWIKEKKFISPIRLGSNTSIVLECELKSYMDRVTAGECPKDITLDIEQQRKLKPSTTTH